MNLRMASTGLVSMVFVALVATATACGGATTDDPAEAPPSVTPAGGASRSAGRCCPPDPKPGCCMDFGGWVEGDSCGKLHYSCDGIPLPNDPAWKLETDEHDCDHWSVTFDRTRPFCGGAASP